jgi:hypothetical protein
VSTAVLTKESLNPFEFAHAQFDTAADYLMLDDGCWMTARDRFSKRRSVN